MITRIEAFDKLTMYTIPSELTFQLASHVGLVTERSKLGVVQAAAHWEV